ncbi:unnamed protein product [Candidula unifasciata]|uniref:C-type lectin domain-containing protein n=1 Tax=Candidula unifasciata TaxID=100452 RepID=A0A8S3YJ47_9EUPU|nr:unnamed protein product [Candidula unifasciata]
MLCVVLFLALTAHSVLAECTEGWLQFEDLCVNFNMPFLTWDDALEVCRAYGAILVQDNSQEKHDWLVEQMKSRGILKLWTGGRRDSSGVWKWVQSNETFSYVTWYPGEPNYNFENCVYLTKRYNYNWNNQVCSYKIPFACERRTPSSEGLAESD